MEKKQSSIEWFHNELEHEGNTHGFISKKMLDIHFNRAKAMHKEESELLFECGRNFQLTGEGIFNQAYKETFGGQDNE